MIAQRYETKHEDSGRLDNSEAERFVARAIKVTGRAQANAVLTMGLSKGWRFRCNSGDEVALWVPVTGETATTYTLTNAALWRAIKNRDASLT